MVVAASPVNAQLTPGMHQTDTVTQIIENGELPYELSLQVYDFGMASLPTLHSYAAGEYDGKWVLLAGRTNGLHGFMGGNQAGENFPPEFQNREVWVIDPVTRQSWSRSLETEPGTFNDFQLNSLTQANNQFMQQGDELYMVGGYGLISDVEGTETFGTFDTLSAINLPGIVDWVQTGSGEASDHVRQIQDSSLQVTGGAMFEIGGTTHLIFGQNYEGVYRNGVNGIYTNQIRSFDIVDDGSSLSLANSSASAQEDDYRRRDLNVFPRVKNNGGEELDEGIVVLSGVFTEQTGVWTVPVEIDADGNPSMADPQGVDTFKQGFNGYHAAKLGFYSAAADEHHELLFGGLSVMYLDEDLEQVIADDDAPFVNDITSVVIDTNGDYAQYHLGYFPELLDDDENRLRFGANAEFFLADGIATYDNGVINLDALSGETVIGYIYGGIVSNGPHARGNPNVETLASNTIFQVILTTAVSTPGDYDGNGTVGPEDYALWKTDFGSTANLDADGNGDGIVNAADYVFWRNLYTAGSGSAAAVPEPGTWVLMVLASCLALARRH
jgi:hypothetical protein